MTRLSHLRSPVVAALLSFMIPGLGQALAGRRRRGLLVAIPALVLVGSLAVLLVVSSRTLMHLALDQRALVVVLVVDLLLLPYHAWVVVDAYRVARRPIPAGPIRDDHGRAPRGYGRQKLGLASVVGVGLILMSTVAVHGALAAADTGWQHVLDCLTAATPCWVSPGPGTAAGAGVETSTSATNGTSWTWNPNGQFNVLLAGIGVQDDPSALGPDTIMVLHVDRASGRAALISVGRNNVCVPLPPGVAEHFPRARDGCPAGTWYGLINDFPNDILGHCEDSPLFRDTCGQPNDPNRYLRAYRTFEAVIGNLLGLTIDGSVWVNPVGLTRLIDDVGGVEINVPKLLQDGPCGPPGTWQHRFASCPDAHNGYSVPTGTSGIAAMRAEAATSQGLLAITWSLDRDVALTIKPGLQHLDGDWALAFARTRVFTGGDFGREGRQQLLLKALRAQLDPCSFASPMSLVPLLHSLSDVPYAFNTDLPLTNVDALQSWAALAKRVVGGEVRSVVLDPSVAGEIQLARDHTSYPEVEPSAWARIKAVVAQSLTPPPAGAPSPGPSASPQPGPTVTPSPATAGC